MAFRLRLSSAPAGPLYRRIDAALRGAIERGELRPSDRLPSVIDLARDLKVNKLTVLKAFRALERDGLVTSHVGRGTFVGTAPTSSTGTEADSRGTEVRLSSPALSRVREGYARGLREVLQTPRPAETIDLGGGVPSPDSVPERVLEDLSARALARGSRRLYGYGGPAGLAELREAIAKRLSGSGVDATPDQVLITNGSQQAIGLIAAWARQDGRSVHCETPTFTGIPNAFQLFGHSVTSIPWKDDALDAKALEASAASQRPLVYVCPDFHNPTGATMSQSGRDGLAAWAKTSGGVVVDDAIFRELRFEGMSPKSLYATLPHGHRFLVGSLSKSFMTGLRVGFLVADEPLIATLLPLKRSMDLGGPSLIQAMAAAFLEDGYQEHVETVSPRYRAGRDAAVDALSRHMPKGVTWTRPEGGFQLWVTMPRGISSIALFLQGIERGVAIQPGPAHDIDGRFESCFRLGFGHETPERITLGIRRLGEALHAVEAQGARGGVGPGFPV